MVKTKINLGTKSVVKWGTHSLAVGIDRTVVKSIGLVAGDEVEMTWNGSDEIVIKMPLKGE